MSETRSSTADVFEHIITKILQSTLKDPTDPTSAIPLQRGHMAIVRAFQEYVRHKGATVGSNILQFTSDDFDIFRVSVYSPNAPVLTTSTSTRAYSVNNPQRTFIDSFYLRYEQNFLVY